MAGLREELVSKTYRPDPVRRIMIPKIGGGERALGIPTILSTDFYNKIGTREKRWTLQRFRQVSEVFLSCRRADTPLVYQAEP